MQALHGWLLLLCIYFADKSKLGLWFKWLLQVVLSTTRQFFVFCTALGTAQSCLWLGLLCVLVLRLSDVRSNAYLEFKLIVLPYYTLTTVFLSMLISRACILQTHDSALFFTAVNCEMCGVFFFVPFWLFFIVITFEAFTQQVSRVSDVVEPCLFMTLKACSGTWRALSFLPLLSSLLDTKPSQNYG